MQRGELLSHLDEFLQAGMFRDYAPNGLQVEGRAEIRRILLGVSASRSLVEEAVSQKVDAILVHHGWFWRGEPAPVVGMKRERLAPLLANDINLIAYHLPLDAHPTVGNNAELGRLLDLTVTARAGDYELLWVGEPKRGEMSVAAFAERVEAVLGRRPLVLGLTERTVRRVAWCSGAAQGEIGLAAALGADLFLSGEVSERTTYEAEELGVTYLAAGHHATEQFGIRALGRHLAERWPELDLRFFDTKNPV